MKSPTPETQFFLKLRSLGFANEYTACLLQHSVITIFFMKQFVIDELRPTDYKTLKTHLDDTYGAAAMDGIYWLPIAKEVLSDIQMKHKDCQPFYVAIDLEPDRIAVELLVRTQSRVRCGCMAYATESQFVWLIRQLNTMFEILGIKS